VNTSGLTATPAGSPQRFVATFALIAAAIGVLFVADMFLVQLQRSADRAQAEGRYRDGVALMDRGDPPGAMESFRDALAVQRDDRRYQLALADAALAAGRPTESAAAVAPTLEHDATDAAANLAMARALLAEGKVTEAVAYYHRAIYGHWPPQSGSRRLAVRMELVEVLARRGAREDLLSELLLVQNDAPADSAVRRHLAHLFVLAGSPARATTLFREMLQRQPDDADALGGLGQAEFSGGDYRGAEADLLRASRLAPADTALAHQLDRVREVRQLDPLVRGLGAHERERRSRRVLTMVADAAAGCPALTSAAPVRAVIDSVRSELQRESDARLLDRADQIWAVMPGSCRRGPGNAESSLDLVMDKLAQ
jgi:tetratricopeptide (TPR) repeat protein